MLGPSPGRAGPTGDKQAEFSPEMSDQSSSGQSSVIGVPVNFLPQWQLKLRQADKFLASGISIVSYTISSSLGAGRHPALPKHSDMGCCYVSTSSMSELRSLGPLQDVLVLALTLLVGLCLGGGETEIMGKVGAALAWCVVAH